MAGVNRVIILGRLGRDPELVTTQGGNVIVNFSLATSDKFKKKSGEVVEETEWHRCIAYNNVANLIADYCHKGDSLYVEGKAKTRKWMDDKTAQEKIFHEVIVDKIAFVGGGNGQEPPNKTQQPAQRPAQQRAPRQQAAPQQTGFEPDDFDDDIPF